MLKPTGAAHGRGKKVPATRLRCRRSDDDFDRLPRRQCPGAVATTLRKCRKRQTLSGWSPLTFSTRRAATSTSPTRSPATGRSTSYSSRATSRTSSSTGPSRALRPSSKSSSSFCRLIRFDKRGTGMSDRVSGAPSLETRMDDVRAVMDAVASSRAAFYGLSEGAAMSILFAATYPERTAALVVRSAYPRRMWAPDYPWGQTEEAYEREVERALRVFGPREQGLRGGTAVGPVHRLRGGLVPPDAPVRREPRRARPRSTA